MRGYVYILEDSLGKYYVGSTFNIERRMKQHIKGQTRTTKATDSLELRFVNECNNLSQARELEKKLKQMKRKDYLAKMIDDGYIKIATD